MVDFADLTDQQRTAVDALDRNVSLTAGAGTGKTTTLTARYVRMLERGLDDAPAADASAADASAEDVSAEDAPADDVGTDADSPLLPGEIVTTTFTERAANELRSEIRDAITERAADAEAETYEQWRAVADGLEEGYIHTLHGFCARLLREHALTASAVDPGFETLDESETSALLEDTVAGLLETHDDHEAVRTLTRLFDRGALRDVLTDLLTERPGGVEWAERWVDATEAEYLAYVNQELHPIGPELAADRLADPAFVDAVDVLQGIVDAPPAALDTGGQAWTRATGVLDRLDGVAYHDGGATIAVRDCFADLCAHLTTGDGERYASYTGAKGRWDGAAAEKAAFDDAMRTIVDHLAPDEHLVDASIAADRNSVPFVRALADLTLLAHEAYADRKRRRNVVDFADQIEFALRFLREDASAALRRDLRERFAYVMVDEFQDTDPRQWDLVRYLTAADPDDFDAENVFVVGDAKQSIYRFRNADVTQFRATARELSGSTSRRPDGEEGADAAEHDELSTNFRTLPPILAFVNELFDAVFEADGPAYEAAPQRLDAFRDDPADLAAVEYLAVPTDADYRERRFAADHPFATARVEHAAELEGMALAARLTQLFDEPSRVYDADADVDDPEPRAVRPEDVAVLLRSRTHLERYTRALDDAGVPFTVASGRGFYETPEVTALLNLLRALADPSDERALYGALRSPLFGLPDDALALLKRDGEPLWDALASATADELADAHDLLTDWRSAAGLGSDADPHFEGSWAAFISRIVDDTGYLASVSADERPRQAVANVEKFREQLRGFGDDGVTSLRSLVDRIERQRELGTREGEATIRGGGDGVQLLTVHDAKGMEFPVVVVPGIGHGFNTRAAVADGRVEFEEMGDGYAVGLKAPDPDDAFEMTGSVAREAIRERRIAADRAEEKRILYVACTRARDRLLLTGVHDLESDEEEPTLADVVPAEPDDASSWRDWVQPHVLTEETLAALAERDRVAGTLGDAPVTVSLPTPAVDWTDDPDVSDPRVDLSAAPPRPERRFRLSPTDLASLFDGRGSLRVDDRTNTVRYEAEDAAGPDADADDDAPDRAALEATVFGELVHRLCELRPPEDRRDDVIDRTHAAEGAAGELTPSGRERVREHAARAMAFVDDLHRDCEVEYTYDELHVTGEFDRGEVSGLIDHLVVTPGAYHVVDYKTNDVAADDVEAKAAYYRTQMEAYAVALHQHDPGRDVTATLYFTTPDEPRRFAWSPSELETLATDVAARIETAIESHID